MLCVSQGVTGQSIGCWVAAQLACCVWLRLGTCSAYKLIVFFFFFFWEAQVTWTDLMNQATQRSEQKHRQPVKPELAAGTGGTPQRCCNWAASSACWNRALQQPTQVKIVRHGQPNLRTLREAQRPAVQAGKRLMAASASRYQRPLKDQTWTMPQHARTVRTQAKH
jgi:hypothetical protein